MKALLDIGEEAAKFTGQLEKALKVSEYGALLKLCPCIDQGCSFLSFSLALITKSHHFAYIVLTHTLKKKGEG